MSCHVNWHPWSRWMLRGSGGAPLVRKCWASVPTCIEVLLEDLMAAQFCAEPHPYPYRHPSPSPVLVTCLYIQHTSSHPHNPLGAILSSACCRRNAPKYGPRSQSEAQEEVVFGGDRVGRVSLQVGPVPESTFDPSDWQGHIRPVVREWLHKGLPVPWQPAEP